MLDAEEYFHLALHASSIGNPHASLVYLRRVLQQDPQNAGALYLLATVHAELGLVERAIHGIEAVLAIDPQLTIAHLQLAMLLLFETQRRAEARSHLMHVTATGDESLQTYAEALIAVTDDDIPLATEKLESAIAKTGENTPFTTLMRSLLEQLDQQRLTGEESETMGVYGHTGS